MPMLRLVSWRNGCSPRPRVIAIVSQTAAEAAGMRRLAAPSASRLPCWPRSQTVAAAQAARGGEREDDAADQFDLHVARRVCAPLFEHDPGDPGDDERAADRQRPRHRLAQKHDREKEGGEGVSAVRDRERAGDAEVAERIDVERIAHGLADDARAHHREAREERHLFELDEAGRGDQQPDEHQAGREAAYSGHQQRAKPPGLRGEQHGRKGPEGGRSESRSGAHSGSPFRRCAIADRPA